MPYSGTPNENPCKIKQRQRLKTANTPNIGVVPFAAIQINLTESEAIYIYI